MSFAILSFGGPRTPDTTHAPDGRNWREGWAFAWTAVELADTKRTIWFGWYWHVEVWVGTEWVTQWRYSRPGAKPLRES